MVCPQSTAVCAVFSTTKQARALVDSSIHHRRPASSAPGVVHDTSQQWMILLQHLGSIGASSGASDVARNSRTRKSTITLGGTRRTKRYVGLGVTRGGPAMRIFSDLRRGCYIVSPAFIFFFFSFFFPFFFSFFSAMILSPRYLWNRHS